MNLEKKWIQFIVITNQYNPIGKFPPATTEPKLANSLALYFAKLNKSMPIEKISLSDPFSHDNATLQNRSLLGSNQRKSRLPHTISYVKRTVNSETDLAYIRKGAYKPTIQQTQSRFPSFEVGISEKLALSAPILDKTKSIGSKTYFMPQMIIGVDPKPHCANQLLSSDE